MYAAIKIKNLNQYYGKKQALKDINLTIHTGMFGLLGRNGAGKTTLMKVIATLLPRSEGEVNVCGKSTLRASDVRRIVGYLPQDFSMYPNMTVYEAMDYLGVLSGLSRTQRRQQILELLERVNLQDDQRKRVKALSGGMKRRLGIAQAILHNPKVLIVEATCEDIAVLDGGKIIYQGTVAELLGMTKGKVYSAEISKGELEALKKDYIVTSMLTLGNNVMVRFLAEEMPFASAKLCEAGVEDAYMYLMHTERGASGC